jgi:hypothetical protein
MGKPFTTKGVTPAAGNILRKLLRFIFKRFQGFRVSGLQGLGRYSTLKP